MRLRIQITKEAGIRFISHLEYMSALTRALRRAKLPVAYSEGFNPHIRFSLASALGVGITSCAEFAEIELAQEIGVDEALARLRSVLPAGIKVITGDIVDSHAHKLMAIASGADYEVTVPCPVDITTALETYNGAETVVYLKHMPKGKTKFKEVNAKDYIKTIVGTWDGAKALLSFSLRITPTGSMKVAEILTLLKERFGLPLDLAQADVKRLALYRMDAKGRKHPLIKR